MPLILKTNRLCFFLLPTTAFFIFPASVVFAATLLGRQAPFGDIVQSLTARQVAMGGTKIVATDDATAAFINPARLSMIRKFNFIAAPALYSTYEKATHSDASESFDENFLTYPDIPLVAAGYSFEKWTLSVGWGNFYDLRYFYDEQTFFEGKLSAQKRAEDFGEIRVLVGAASYRFEKGSLGISYLAYRGTPSYSYRNLTFNPQTGNLISSTVQESEKVFGGRQVMGGASYSPDDKLTLGAILKGRFTMSETEVKVNQGIRSQTAREWKMPWELGLGLTYKFPEKWTKPMLAFDVVKTWWGKSEVSTDSGIYQPAGLVDTISYHLGMEHYLNASIPLRYGLSLVPFYSREEADTFSVSLGSGYIWNFGNHSVSFEISGEYQIRSTSGTTRLFSEPEDPNYPFINQDVVNSYVKRFIATISYKF